MIEVDAARSYFDEGLELFDQEQIEEALVCFRCGHEADPDNAQLRSYYGLCLGLVERKFQQSAELCQSAARQEFFNPRLYLNLARLYLTFGFKSEGMRYLQRGKMIDSANVDIGRELAELGRRDPPVILFLPRGHLVNRWLGVARHRLAQWTAARSRA
jgi:tetratricopeptide (TPR) repeat protein